MLAGARVRCRFVRGFAHQVTRPRLRNCRQLPVCNTHDHSVTVLRLTHSERIALLTYFSMVFQHLNFKHLYCYVTRCIADMRVLFLLLS